MEEKGHNTGGDMPGPLSTAECPEVTTIPYGEDAFVYGNVCGEGPEGRVMAPISGDEYAWAAREVKELRNKMTIEELEALSVLTSLPRPFSSRQLINCLEFDDAEARVFEIMGRKGSGRNWFQSIGNERAEVSRPGSSSGHAVGQPRIQVSPTGPTVLSVPTDETIAVEEQLVRKRKVKAVDVSGVASKKQKEKADEPERPIPLGVWDSSFTLGHKVELNLDNSEKKIIENMSEQQIADAMLEMTTRAQMLAWHMAYASDRGTLRVELEKVRAERKELIEARALCESKQKRSEQLLKEAEVLLNDARDAGRTLKKERDQMSSKLEQAKKEMAVLIRERDDLRAADVEDKELIEELKDVVVIEHTRGFRKALRQVGHLSEVSIEGIQFDIQKDVHEGQLKPLNEIPEDAFLGEGEEAVVNDEPALETVGDVVNGTPNIVID
ncbi:hypothetical protein LR48_Vigan01g256400 [Vigna angularis]|uniref:Uncharacterized protein n=1 Tax=Phaseolus angularis TaxID=3914 RepID=A0A0L9TR14_PHAAN|nr:hypothetical protein LR48_Vigan01g256400 [Vigna angularis]